MDKVWVGRGDRANGGRVLQQWQAQFSMVDWMDVWMAGECGREPRD